MARKETPPPLGAVLRFLRFGYGWSEEELAEALGVSPSLISRYERKGLRRERLEELLAVMDVPVESIDAALFALELGRLPEGSGSPVDPTPAQRRSIHRAAAVAGWNAAKATLARLTANLRRIRADRACRRARELVEALKKMAPQERRKAVETERKYWSPMVAVELCEESIRAAAHQAKRALELAGLALRVAEFLPVAKALRELVQGFCWAFVGNARRVQGDLRGAEEAFLHSDRLWEAGGPADPELFDGARLLDLKASLRSYQGRLQEAVVLLDQAFTGSQSEGSRARILVKKAIALRFLGAYERALAVTRQAESLIDRSEDPRFPWLVQFNRTINLWHLERHPEAAELMPGVWESVADLGNELDLQRSLWLDARVKSGLGKDQEALPALEQVQRYFTVKQIAYDAALASLEVSELLLEQGRTAEVRVLAEQMYWIFKNQQVQEEALRALGVFCEAARQETATVGLTRQVRDFLLRAQHDPRLRFEP